MSRSRFKQQPSKPLKFIQITYALQFFIIIIVRGHNKNWNQLKSNITGRISGHISGHISCLISGHVSDCIGCIDCKNKG